MEFARGGGRHSWLTGLTSNPWLLIWLAAAIFAIVVLVLQTGLLGFERSPFVLMTSPFSPDSTHRNNPFFAYSMVVDDGGLFRHSMLHKENISYLYLSRKLVGGDVPVNGYDGRVMLPYLASSLSWIVGTIPAALFANALLWSGAIVAAFAFGRGLAGKAGGFILAGFVAAGFGYWFHTLDLTAHLAAFATYMIGGWAVYRSGLWSSPKGWRTHAVVALVLAIACATYNSGIMLVAVYLVSGLIGRNKLLFLIPAAGAALVFQAGWLPLMELFGVDPLPIRRLESQYFSVSLNLWLQLLTQDPGRFFTTVRINLIDLLIPEPATAGLLLAITAVYVPARLAKAITVRFDWRLFGLLLALGLMPPLLSLPWGQAAPVRGYVSYHGYIGIYAGITVMVTSLWRAGRIWRWVGGSIFLIGATLQIVMLASAMSGNLSPIRTYFVGGNMQPELSSHLLASEPLEVRSLSGGDMPRSLGGTADIGAWLTDDRFSTPDIAPAFKMLPRTLAWRLYFCLPFILLGLLWAAQKPRSLRWPAPFAALIVLLALPAAAAPLRLGGEKIRSGYFEYGVDASKAKSVRYDAHLTPETAAALAALAMRGGGIELSVTPASSGTTISLWLNDRELPMKSPWAKFSAEPFSGAKAGDVLSLRYQSDESVGWMLGYRPTSTPQTRLLVDGIEDPARPFLPYFELRGFNGLELTRWPVLLVF